MRAARRYRLGLLVFPRAVRRERGAELLRVLAEVDSDRGSASWREAAYLVSAGAALRVEQLARWLRPGGMSSPRVVAAVMLAGCGARVG